jgi:hypothetical protein
VTLSPEPPGVFRFELAPAGAGRSWAGELSGEVQGEQRNKWQGPAGGGKDAVYAGCELEPMEVERYPKPRDLFSFSPDSFPPLSVFAVLQCNLLAFDNVCCPNASFVLGCSV